MSQFYYDDFGRPSFSSTSSYSDTGEGMVDQDEYEIKNLDALTLSTLAPIVR